ncbi:MAG: GNAT family N-acetyltransferase [Actinobacteria bacterium]|nr:GNAT family N-acetyltransferase [Actinomycetota bacterium]
MTELTDVPSAFAYGDSLLTGDRVRLRALIEDDLPALARWEMDPGRQVTLTDRVAPPSEARARERFARMCANDGDAVGFSVVALDDPQPLVGSVSMFGISAKDRSATIGIALAREYMGRGYGTDAMRVIVAYGFRELGLHRIALTVAPFNAAGVRAYEKAGFTEEGRHREAVWHDGRWYDEVLMSVLEQEWAGRRAGG